MNKRKARLRRAKKGRIKIRQLGIPRLCVYRTPHHIYAQLIFDKVGCVVVCASTVEKALRTMCSEKKMNNMEIAEAVGKLIAERALHENIKKIAFDRSGFKYHGRVKALAEGARGGGLEF
jgi:large subunit ribosomal protein L18